MSNPNQMLLLEKMLKEAVFEGFNKSIGQAFDVLVDNVVTEQAHAVTKFREAVHHSSSCLGMALNVIYDILEQVNKGV
jgi:flagellar biosynthesis regulator FlbT